MWLGLNISWLPCPDAMIFAMDILSVAKQFLFLFICHLDNLWGIGYEERGRMGLYNFFKSYQGNPDLCTVRFQFFKRGKQMVDF